MKSSSTCRQCLRYLEWTSGSNAYTTKHKWKAARASSSFLNARTRKNHMQTSRIYTTASGKIPQTWRPRGAFQIRSRSTVVEDPIPDRLLLKKDNLFHPFSKSPLPAIRRRATFMMTHAYCPHPDHHPTRVAAGPDDLEARKTPDRSNTPPAHVQFECPDCGIPVYCSEEHWADDYETHMEICDTLRQANEDDHDIRSGRVFHEFDSPFPDIEEFLPNMSSWDTYLYTREFQAMNEPRSLRLATRGLTYPMTIASVLHELSPYHIRRGGRLTYEGLRSLTALRYTIHPPKRGEGPTIEGLRPDNPPARIFILGARAESSLPRNIWIQMPWLFHRNTFHIIFIGPESMTNRDDEFPLPEKTSLNPFGAVIEDRLHQSMKMTTYVDYFHTLHKAQHFHPYDPYFDCFVLFHPGLGHPASSHEWEETLPMLLETKMPIFCTGYTPWDLDRDIKWVHEKVGDELDILMHPGENLFRSLRWDINDYDPSDVSCGNWGIWGFRGKRYEAAMQD